MRTNKQKSGKYAKLKNGWMLRGWSDMPRTLVNWTNGDQRELTPMGFYVAQSCDARTDFESFAFLPRHLGMLELLIEEGIAEPCPKGNRIAAWQRYRKAENPRLSRIHWCVTGKCNLKCRHCYMEAPSGRYGQLPFKTMAGLVEQFERANVLDVSLTGGEPFLRKDLLAIIELLAHKHIRLAQIYSNGLLIRDQHLEKIKKIGFCPAFQVSFDGVGTHDHMRGTRGSEPKVIDAIGRIRAAGFPVVVSSSIDKANIAGLTDTYELMRRLDVQSWRIAAPQEIGNWRGTTTAMTVDQQAQVCAPLMKRWVADGKPFAIQLGGFYLGSRPRKPQGDQKPAARQANAVKRAAQQGELPHYTPDTFDCGSCREQPNLLPDGTLVPCPGYVDSILQDRMPNLLREDLSQAWTNSFLRTISDMRKKDLLAVNSDCAACELFKECGVGCRASALTATGNLMSKDPLACELCKKGYKKQFLKMVALELAATG